MRNLRSGNASLGGSREYLGLELIDERVEGFLGKTSAGESQVGASSRSILVSLGSHAEHDAVSTTSTTRESPVEIGVLVAVGEDVVTTSSDNLPFENLIGSHAVKRSQSRVSTTLTISASNTDSRAGSGDDLKALVEGSLVDFKALHTSANLDGLAAVVLVRPVLEFDVFEMVGPKAESTRSSALAVEVMASVAYTFSKQ